MRSTIAFLALTLSASASLAASPHYFCYGDDGSDLSITVDPKTKTATLNGEDVHTTYRLTQVFESLPAQYIYGSKQDCAITFVAYADGHTGTASFRCSKKFPRALELDMECSYQAR